MQIRFPLPLNDNALAVVFLGAGMIVSELATVSASGERIAFMCGGALAGYLSKALVDKTAPKQEPPDGPPV